MTKTAPDLVGTCEGCGKQLFEGMKGHICEEGDPIFCAECADFTWSDIKDQWEKGEREEADDDEARAEFMRSYEAHIAAGGSPDDVILHDL